MTQEPEFLRCLRSAWMIARNKREYQIENMIAKALDELGHSPRPLTSIVVNDKQQTTPTGPAIIGRRSCHIHITTPEGNSYSAEAATETDALVEINNKLMDHGLSYLVIKKL